MGNVFKNDEQRKHWNAYNNEYSKKTYKTITIKLNKIKDKDILDYMDNFKSPTEAIRSIVREKLNK